MTGPNIVCIRYLIFFAKLFVWLKSLVNSWCNLFECICFQDLLFLIRCLCVPLWVGIRRSAGSAREEGVELLELE